MNIHDMMKQAQVMQKRMEELQETMGRQEVNGQAGGGMVAVRMTGRGLVRQVSIAPELMNPAEKETLEDLVAAAVNNAKEAADALIAEETQRLMGGMGLPLGGKIPGF